MKKLFTCRMVDRSGEVTVVGFNSEADVFQRKIVTGKCYRLSLYQTKHAKYAQAGLHLTKVVNNFFYGQFMVRRQIKITRLCAGSKGCGC